MSDDGRPKRTHSSSTGQSSFALVQRLPAAKRDLRLEKELAVLDAYDAVILDDIAYQQSRDEMEVLFTFLAERYQRHSVIITSNVVFSEWNRIFNDPMTAAEIDRLVHHSVSLGDERRQLPERRRRRRSRLETRSMGKCSCR